MTIGLATRVTHFSPMRRLYGCCIFPQEMEVVLWTHCAENGSRSLCDVSWVCKGHSKGAWRCPLQREGWGWLLTGRVTGKLEEGSRMDTDVTTLGEGRRLRKFKNTQKYTEYLNKLLCLNTYHYQYIHELTFLCSTSFQLRWIILKYHYNNPQWFNICVV